MASPLAEAHITAQERLRKLTALAVQGVWSSLPAYNQDNADEWLTRVLPLIAASQRQSVSLTEAFLARAVGRAALGVDPSLVTGPAVRSGTRPEDVYRRPLVSVWGALTRGTPWADAVPIGEARASSTAEMDVQLAMRATLVTVGERDPEIVGYQRVPDGDACRFCLLVAGQRYRTDQLMPVHNRCGCGVDVITTANRSDFSGNPDNDLSIEGVRVQQHGELGPILTDAQHAFQGPEVLQGAGGQRPPGGGGRGGAGGPGAGGPQEVDAERFSRAFASMRDHPHVSFLTPYTTDEFSRMRCFLAGDDRVGGAVKTAEDGRLEAVSIFNAGGGRGAGSRMLRHLVAEGADRLDCIGDDLRKIYERGGFVVTETLAWDDQYAPAGWDYATRGRPNIYVMELAT